MFESNYKFELEDNIKCAKYVYNSQKRKQDKIIAILLPILMVGMIAMLIVDIVNKKSVIWDIALLVMLGVLQVMYITMPLMVVKQTKKSYAQQKFAEMDSVKVTINDNVCKMAFVKDGVELEPKTLHLKMLTSYIEDNDSLVLVFNKVEYIMIKKDGMKGDLKKLKAILEKAMAKSSKG